MLVKAPRICKQILAFIYVNSWFSQARAIDDLAKKVFYALKTDPENFEMEFSGTRRRSVRRPLQAEARNAICNSSNKPATNSRSYSRKPHSSAKRMDSSTNGLSVLRKSRLNSSCSVAATTCSDSGDHGLLFGMRCLHTLSETSFS